MSPDGRDGRRPMQVSLSPLPSLPRLGAHPTFPVVARVMGGYAEGQEKKRGARENTMAEAVVDPGREMAKMQDGTKGARENKIRGREGGEVTRERDQHVRPSGDISGR